MELAGKVALVTGGSRGIGRGICLALARAGSDVVVNYVSNAAAAQDTVAELKKLGVRAMSFQADVAEEAHANNMIEQAMKEFGRVDVLVNNAGITRDKSFMKMSTNQWKDVLHVNLDGPFNMTRAVLPQMAERGWGRIINISSVVAEMGAFGQANYAVTKGGLIAFTRTLALEVARKGVTVNCIAPGYIATDMTAVMPAEVLDKVKNATPVGRLGTPEDIGRAVLFLASPAASFVTGVVLDVNGGYHM